MRWSIGKRGNGHKYRCEALQDALTALGIERDLLIIDNYMRKAEPGAVIIDDLVRDCTGAALVINPCPGVSPAEYPGVKALCGPEYAMVRSCFVPGTAEERRNVVVYAPGSAKFAPQGEGFKPPSPDAENPAHMIWVDGFMTGPILAWWLKQAKMAYVSCSQIVFECARMQTPFQYFMTAPNQARLFEGMLACKGQIEVDGLGAQRVAEAIGALP